MPTTHPLAVDHPYYAAEGNYYANGWHKDHPSWASFIEEMGTADEDLNLVYRWDVHAPDADDSEPVWEVSIFYVLQRKAATMSRRVKIEASDLPAVEMWLRPKWEQMRRLWAPLSGVEIEAQP